MEGVLTKVITVSSTDTKEFDKKDGSGKSMRLTIKDGEGKKYAFFKTKIDGEETKAYEALKTGKVALMQDTGIGYKEEERTFTNNENKEITYMDRKIVFFFDPNEMKDKEINQDKRDAVGDLPF